MKHGRITQLAECLLYTQEVGGSNPSVPTRFVYLYGLSLDSEGVQTFG